MKRFKLLLGILFFIFVFSLGSCDKSVEPREMKDPRLLTWTIDTIMYPGSFQTCMTKIWGSSQSDIYIVGHNDDIAAQMYHYDGNNWKQVKLHSSQGGPLSGRWILSDIKGFSNKDIWVAGTRWIQNFEPPYKDILGSLLIHYDGYSWKEIQLEGGHLTTVFGMGHDNIIVGSRNKIWTYNGSSWSLDTLPVKILPSINFYLYPIEGKSSEKIYALAKSHQDEIPKDVYYFFQYKSQIWTIIDTAVIDPERNEYKWGYENLWMSPEGSLFSSGWGVFKWEGNTWNKLLSCNWQLFGIGGASENNFFAVGVGGRIYHYDGVDWCQFTQFLDENMIYTDIWTDGYEVFILGHTYNNPQSTVVLHGK